jgi:hypothetical protein
VSIASANCSTERWNGEDFVLVELVGESGAESGAAVEIPGAVGIGEVGSTSAARSFGSGADIAACVSNSCAPNSCVGDCR